MFSAAEMLAGFINSYMKWDWECRYCGNYVETERREQQLLCCRMIPERILGLELLGNKKCLMYGWSAVF